MMTKSDTIEAILTLNRTAARPFLAEFSNAELNEYLRRLRGRPDPQQAAATLSDSDIETSLSAVAQADCAG